MFILKRGAPDTYMSVHVLPLVCDCLSTEALRAAICQVPQTLEATLLASLGVASTTPRIFLLHLLTTTTPRATAVICMDNRVAFETLQLNKYNHECVHRVLETISDLRLLGWEISTTWCPSHCNINGNERADTLAKRGASSTVPCHFALTTKTWLLAQACAELLRQWKTELPLSKPSFKFPSHLHRVNWADTRAIWRVFCN